MVTYSPLLAICAGNSPVTSKFPAQRPVTRSFDVFFDLRLINRLSKQRQDKIKFISRRIQSTNNSHKTIVKLVIWDTIAPIMTSLQWNHQLDLAKIWWAKLLRSCPSWLTYCHTPLNSIPTTSDWSSSFRTFPGKLLGGLISNLVRQLIFRFPWSD